MTKKLEEAKKLDPQLLLTALVALKNGDFSISLSEDLQGIDREIAHAFNKVVEQNRKMETDLEGLSNSVAYEGNMEGRLPISNVKGSWKNYAQYINKLIENLIQPLNEVTKVILAVSKGDLTKKMILNNKKKPIKGEFLRTAKIVNAFVTQLYNFSQEVTRVSREVGIEGKLGGQAEVQGVSGVWRELTNHVNVMANNLTTQVRAIAKVVTGVANGDLKQKLTFNAKGEIATLADTINLMIDTLDTFAAQVTNVAREVGTEGKLGGQAEVPGAAGIWRDLTDNVNYMASNLTSQVRNIAEVATAVARGDLSKKITVEAKGEILDLKDTLNTMMDQLNSFAAEVTRMAREVGTDGILGGQALVKGVAGVWKDLTDNVNYMANNLTTQVRGIARVVTGVANGDLKQKLEVEASGEIEELAKTINLMIGTLDTFAAQVTNVAREVGTEGKLGGQAEVPGAAGIWRDLTDNVNSMAKNLTNQVRDIATVSTAVAQGDLSQKITVQVKGEILDLKNTINTMVDQINSFAAEVTRVARDVGTEGKLGGQAEVKGTSGIWKELTDSVNVMANNLTIQVRGIAKVVTGVAKGDLKQKLTFNAKGEIATLADTINLMIDTLDTFAAQVTNVAREVGTEGKLGGQAEVPNVAGIWKDLTNNVNYMASNLTSQVRNIAEVATAVARGDLSKKITVEAKGEILNLKNTINTMVDQLNSFAAEVTRVAREVGTEGILGGQAEVPGVAGIWKKLTDSVNSMANNLTIQVRGIARVVTGVAKGDLKQKLMVEAKGEILALAEIINAMSNTLAIFAEQVTTVAREVGVEGKLGGQASVPGASGTWKDLTDNVNQLASNLTTQVRAIAEVATAVTNGDLTRTIDVDARGEVAALKDNINTMIRNLKETTRINTEQDWLKTNLAKFTSMLQGQKDLTTVAKMILAKLAPLVKTQHAIFYIVEPDESKENRGVLLRLLSSYAYKERKHVANRFSLGEGLVGQCAFEKERILLTEVPENYIKISSGLGEGTPANIVVLPIIFEGTVTAVVELASFERFSEIHLTFLEQLTESIGVVINTIAATMRTEELLKQSQSLAAKLQSQQEELKKTNEELEYKAQLLEKQKVEVEIKNREIEIAKYEMQEKAEQLAITSKYKSEFLANMSHELRTPLNSLLILAKQLVDNPEENLSEKQVEYAQIIHSSGNDLLMLINDILNLSKIESGTMDVNVTEVPLNSVKLFADQNFSHIAQSKFLNFSVDLDKNVPESIRTDEQKLEQILKNLLSNAFKFTEKGNVSMTISSVKSGWTADHKVLDHTENVLAFSVSDSGIGIPKDKLNIIFEAFQQVDGATNRKYGGTGLGLSISRELARLLGGEIRVESKLKKGSTFTLYLPQYYTSQPLKKTSTEDLFQEKDLQEKRALLSNTFGPEPSTSSEKISEENVESTDSLKVNLLDDRHQIQSTDKVFLMITNNQKMGELYLDIVHKNDCKGVIASDGYSGLLLTKKIKPHAILLSSQLPDINRWHMLDFLKHDLTTRYSPILIICNEDEAHYSLRKGAFSYLSPQANEKLITSSIVYIRSFLERKERNLLILEDNENERFSICELFENTDIHITGVATAKEALTSIQERHFDCIVVDLILPDMSGLNLIKNIKKDPALANLPTVIYTGKELTEREESLFRKMVHSIILKNTNSSAYLLSEVLKLLHYSETNLSESKQQILQRFRKVDPYLIGKKVLIVDDDIRNIFSVASVLEQHQMKVIYADNGKEGIRLLQTNLDVDIVLMDIMMPDIDGYSIIKQIRQKQEYKNLPIIAVTAKAMKEDREKCLEAGASDYISKPLDIDKLLSIIRVWLNMEEIFNMNI